MNTFQYILDNITLDEIKGNQEMSLSFDLTRSLYYYVIDKCKRIQTLVRNAIMSEAVCFKEQQIVLFVCLYITSIF